MTQTIDIAGGVVVWSIEAGTHLDLFNDRLSKHDFHGYRPERLTDGAALKAVLSEAYPKNHKIVRVLGNDDKETDSFEVVQVRPNDDLGNLYVHVMTATVKDGTISLDNGDYDMRLNMQSHFLDLTTLVPVPQVTRTLVSIIQGLGGVTLKPSGGVYFLPDAHWKRWTDFTNDLTGTGSKSTYNGYRVVMDQSTIKGICEALQAEVDKESTDISTTLSDEETGLRAAATARKRAERLRDKIISYEKGFGLALDSMKARLDEATMLEAESTLLETAAQLSFCTLFN